MVPEGQRARVSVCGQIFPKPSVLFRALRAGDLAAVRVQAYHVPFPDLEAVVPLASRPGRLAEVPEVPTRLFRLILVVPRHRPYPSLDSPPRRVEIRSELVE